MPVTAEVDPYERRITVVDIVMIALAILSVGLLVVESSYPLTAEQKLRIIQIDLVVVAIFAVEYVVRLARAPDKVVFVKGHWYDLVGMVPVAHPMFRAFRLFRILRIVVLTSRVIRATNRSFGEAIVERLVGKYKDIIVQELTDRIVLKLLDQVEEVLTKGSYGTSTARALDRNREALIERLNDQLRKDRTTRIILAAPGMERLVEGLQERTISTVISTLGSEEMNETIVAVIRQIIQDLRTEVSRPEWRAPPAASPGAAA